MIRVASPSRLFAWCLFGLIVALAYGALRYHTFVGPSVHDDGLFLYAGQAWAAGEIPYRDFWDHKPPALFFFLSIPLRLFPFSLFAVKAFCALWIAGTALLLFWLLRRFTGWIASGVALLGFVFLTSAFYTIRNGGMTQEPTLFLVALAFALLIRQGGRPVVNTLLAGIAFGVAIQFRQTFALTAAFGFVWLAMQAWKDPRPVKTTASRWLIFIAGMLLMEMIVALYFQWHGAWFEYFKASYYFNFAYIGPSRPEVDWSTFFAIQKEALFSSGPLLALPFFSLPLIPWLTREQRRLLLPLWAAFFGDWISVCLSGEYYSHYYVQAGVSAACLSAIAVDGAVRGVQRSVTERPRWKNALAVPLALAVLITAVWLSQSGVNRYLADHRRILAQRETRISEYAFQYSVANAVRQLTAPDDRILLIGRDPNSVYFRAGRYAGSRYYHYSPLWKEKTRYAQSQRQRDEFLEDLQKRRPVLLLYDLSRMEPNDNLTRVREFVPEALPYIKAHYTPLDEILDEIPYEDWFWYDIRLVFWVRTDQVEAVRARFESDQ